MSILPKLAPATELLIISFLSFVFSIVTLAMGLSLDSTLNVMLSGGLFAVFLVSIPFVIRMRNVNKNRITEASQKIAAALDIDYGIKISPSENLFDYENTLKITEKEILGTDANGEAVLVTLRSDSENNKVVPFITTNAVKIS